MYLIIFYFSVFAENSDGFLDLIGSRIVVGPKPNGRNIQAINHSQKSFCRGAVIFFRRYRMIHHYDKIFFYIYMTSKAGVVYGAAVESFWKRCNKLNVRRADIKNKFWVFSHFYYAFFGGFICHKMYM